MLEQVARNRTEDNLLRDGSDGDWRRLSCARRASDPRAGQGVGYRVNARRMATRLGDHAQPENLPDGSVRIVVSGMVAAVADFRRWCEQGPKLAQA